MFNANDCNVYDGSNIIKKLNHRTGFKNICTCTSVTNASNWHYGLISVHRRLLHSQRFPQEIDHILSTGFDVVARQDSLLLYGV